MKKSILLCLAAASLLMVGCSKKGWGVDGTVENAPEDTKLAIEGLNAGIWYNIDSVEIASDGKFSYRSPEGSPCPDIYRVSLNGRSIYFPIDSLETVTITANGNNFDRDYTLAGSDVAVQMMDVDKKIADFVAANGVQAAVTDSVFKRQLSEIINNDNSGILAYYLVNKTLGNQPIFSDNNRADVRILGAIANKFENSFPNDPRTQYLRDRFLSARSQLQDASKVLMEARETGLLDITGYDAKGKERSLSEVAKNAGVTLLSFTSYDMESSVPYNVELNRLYELFKGQNIAIYQVSVDADEVQWRSAAQNLPWVAVRCKPNDSAQMLSIYNVQGLPTTFVIDRNSDLVERIDGDPAKIEAAIRKHL